MELPVEKIFPLTEVGVIAPATIVKAGVAPPLDEPENPLAVAMETAVTVPVVGVAQVGARVVPAEVKTCPAAPFASIAVVAAAD